MSGLVYYGGVGETYGAVGDVYGAGLPYEPIVAPCRTDAYTFEFEPVDSSNDPVGDLLLVDRGKPPTLTWDLWANYPRTLTGMWLDGTQADDLDVNQRLRVWMVDVAGDRLSLGHLLYTAAPRIVNGYESWDGQPGVFRACALADQAVLLSAPLQESTSFAAATRVSDAITDLINLLEWPLGFTVTATPQQFSEPVTFRAGANLGQTIDSLCTQAGLLPPQWDRDGAGFIVLAPDLDEGLAADHVYTSTLTSDGYTDDDNLLDAPNTWIAVANTPSSGEVSGTYTLPASAPNSVARTGRTIAVQVEAPGAATPAAAVIAARTAALSTPGTTRIVEFAADADYSHDIAGTVDFDGVRWSEQKWSVSLASGAPMTHTLVRPYGES